MCKKHEEEMDNINKELLFLGDSLLMLFIVLYAISLLGSFFNIASSFILFISTSFSNISILLLIDFVSEIIISAFNLLNCYNKSINLFFSYNNNSLFLNLLTFELWFFFNL